MNVAQAIAILQTLPQDSELVSYDPENGSYDRVGSINELTLLETRTGDLFNSRSEDMEEVEDYFDYDHPTYKPGTSIATYPLIGKRKVFTGKIKAVCI